jgi:succinoglycan biosynthesis protein ExoA
MTPLIVIPALNEAAHIEDCVRSLLTHDETARAARTIVMDGGSTDGTGAIVERLRDEFPNLWLINNPRKLQSAALNIAAGLANPHEDVLIRCDAHSLYPKSFISALLGALERTGADAVVTPMDAVGEGCFQRAVAWIVDTPLGSGGAPHRGGTRSGFVDHGHHAAFRLATFTAAGGYDESFSHNEDAELDQRIAKQGGRIWLDAGIRIQYFPRATPGALWKQYRRYGFGRASTILKHRARPAPRQMIPVINLALLVVSLAIMPVSPLLGSLWPAAYLALLVGASLTVALGRRSWCGLGAGLALAIIHIAWAIGFLQRLADVGVRHSPARSA